MTPELWIGTSGWSYRHWRGVFYPPDLPTRAWLRHYASRFATVEVNASFYRLPTRSTFEGWAGQTPPGFRFAVKASRFLTHVRRLRDPEEPVARLLEAASGLGERLGPVLFQLPPRWVPTAERLRALAGALPRGIGGAVEFRDARGYSHDTLALLEELGLALVVHDHPAAPSPQAVTAPFVYLRFHGPGPIYGGEYGERGLDRWLPWIREVAERDLPVYAYFNNDAGGAAVRDAALLRELVGGPQAPGKPGDGESG